MTHAEAYGHPGAPLRSDVYALLGCLLAAPPAARRLRGLAGLAAAPGTPDAVGEALGGLRDACAAAREGSVEREYADLFVGLGRGEILPYASWYRDGLLLSAPLARLRADLAAFGIGRAPGVREPEDHAAALCESMVLIIGRPQVTRRRQAQFFHDHLSPWMLLLFRDLQKARSAVFYRSVGRLGEIFMLLESELLQRQPIEED